MLYDAKTHRGKVIDRDTGEDLSGKVARCDPEAGWYEVHVRAPDGVYLREALYRDAATGEETWHDLPPWSNPWSWRPPGTRLEWVESGRLDGKAWRESHTYRVKSRRVKARILFLKEAG